VNAGEAIHRDRIKMYKATGMFPFWIDFSLVSVLQATAFVVVAIHWLGSFLAGPHHGV
jgi:hypothetical protein